MNVRSALTWVVLGLPAAVLLLFGPRGHVEAPPDRVVVRYWEKWAGVEGEAIRRLVDRFNETVGAERGIWVEYCEISNVDQRLLIATAGGDPPDVAGLFDYVLSQFAEQDALLPLDALVAEAGVDLSSFKPIWLDICRYDGRLYALPSTPYTILLFYNRALFREAGLDPDRPPQTLAELNEYAKRLTKVDSKGKITQLGFTVSPSMLGWWHWVWPFFFGARMLDGDGCRLDEPAAVAALEWIDEYREAVGEQACLDFEAVSVIESADNPFLSGRLAMVFQGPWLTNWARRYAPDLDYGVALFPSSTPERRNVFASVDLFVIPQGAAHPREAMTFLAYMMQPEILDTLNREHGKVSPFREPTAGFYEGHPNPFVRTFDEAAFSPDAFGYPQTPLWPQVRVETLLALNTVLRGPASPADVLRRAQAAVDRALREWRRTAGARSDE